MTKQKFTAEDYIPQLVAIEKVPGGFYHLSFIKFKTKRHFFLTKTQLVTMHNKQTEHSTVTETIRSFIRAGGFGR